MIYLTQRDALPESGSRGFDPHGAGHDTMFIVRHGDVLRAWLDACPHYGGTPMAWRKDAYLDAHGRHIICHAHGAQFDPATGVCVKGPCLGQALSPAPLHIGPDGRIFLRAAKQTISKDEET